MTRHRQWEVSIFAALAIVTAAVYWRVVEADFVYWDDDVLLYANPHLDGLNPASLKWIFFETKYVVRYQPLTWLSWFIVHELFGRGPFGYHLASLLFHCVNTGLVFLLIRKLLLVTFNAVPTAVSSPRAMSREGLPLGPSDPEKVSAGPGSGTVAAEPDTAKCRYLLVCSALGALLWAVHPLRVEVVAWASAFLHCQALFFLLLATLFYLEACTAEPGSQRKRSFFWASVACFAISLLSYPIGLGLVVVLVVLDVYPLGRFKDSWWNGAARKCWVEKIPFVGVAALVLGFTLLLRFNTRAEWGAAASLQDFGLLHRVMQGCYVWAYYLWLPWVPLDLSPVYTTLVRFNPMSPRFLLSLGLVLVLSGGLVWQRRRWPAALAMWICHLAWLVPVLGLTEHPHYANDRYTLVVGLFWSILGSGLLFRLGQNRAWRIPAITILVALTAVLGALTVRQVGIWKNSIVLFKYMIDKLGKDPYRADIYWRLGIVYHQMERYDEAIEAFQRVFDVDPRSYISHRFLGGIYMQKGMLDDAQKHYTAALKVHPEDAGIRNNLGLVLMTKGDLAAAEKEFAEALRHDPKLTAALSNLGVVLVKQGRTNEAKAYLEKVEKTKDSLSP